MTYSDKPRVLLPHPFAPVEFHALSEDGVWVAGLSDWCAFMPGLGPVLAGLEPESGLDVCGLLEGAGVHRPAVCVDCGHRHPEGPCADHGWRDECRYEAGAGCPMGSPLSADEALRWVPHRFVPAGSAGEVCGHPCGDRGCGRSAGWWPHRFEEPGWSRYGSAPCRRPSCHRCGRAAVFGGVQICGAGHQVDPGRLAGGGQMLAGEADPRVAPGRVFCGLAAELVVHGPHGMCPGCPV